MRRTSSTSLLLEYFPASRTPSTRHRVQVPNRERPEIPDAILMGFYHDFATITSPIMQNVSKATLSNAFEFHVPYLQR